MDVAIVSVVMNAGTSSRRLRRESSTTIRQRVRDVLRRSVNRLGDTFIRPHDVDCCSEPNGSTQEAMVQRLVHLVSSPRRARARRRRDTVGAMTREQVEASNFSAGRSSTSARHADVFTDS